MYSIPRYSSGYEVDPEGRYTCPLCGSQATGDAVDTGWVSCPMLDGKVICLGSCIDHQAAARSEDFQSHPDRELFDELTRRSQVTAHKLRSLCMHHQIEVIDEQLQEDSVDSEELAELRKAIVLQLEILSA